MQWDVKRGQWELSKGGHRSPPQQRESTGSSDRSVFATARCELWEEAGVWVAWRARGTYAWLSPKGDVLPDGPAPGQNAWLCIDLWPEDDDGLTAIQATCNQHFNAQPTPPQPRAVGFII